MKKIVSIMIVLVMLIGCQSVPADNGQTEPDDEQPTPSEPLSRAEEILATMTIEEEIGQMFLVRCNKDTALTDLDKYYFGGYLLFADNIKGTTSEELISTIAGYQQASKIKMLIGVDEEGGAVNRLSIYSQYRDEPFASPQDLYAEGGWDLIESDTETKCQFLTALGINLNMAPVADVSTDPEDYIYSRAFGQDAEQTSQYVQLVVTTMNSEKMGSVLKHFPGYGNNQDSHSGITTDERRYESFESTDFLPFIAGIKAGAKAILVAHNIVTAMDDEYPASLSAKVHQILRDELGFTGVIMTDDLKMEAIREQYGDEQSAVLAVLAGNDMIISTYYDVQIPAVIAAYENGQITKEQIDQSVLRILNWKLDLGIIE